MREKLCKCGEQRRPGQRNCRACHASSMREWRKHNPLTDEQRKKDNARSYAGTYYRKGKIKKTPCVVCKSENSEMHHPDYNKPLFVIWLCRDHHLQHHNNGLDIFQYMEAKT